MYNWMKKQLYPSTESADHESDPSNDSTEQNSEVSDEEVLNSSPGPNKITNETEFVTEPEETKHTAVKMEAADEETPDTTSHQPENVDNVSNTDLQDKDYVNWAEFQDASSVTFETEEIKTQEQASINQQDFDEQSKDTHPMSPSTHSSSHSSTPSSATPIITITSASPATLSSSVSSIPKVTVTSTSPSTLPPACLYNQTGKVCNILGQRCIVTEVNNAPVFVGTRIEQCEWGPVGVGLVWCSGRPLTLDQVPDEAEVYFDAVILPGTSKFVALVIWQDTKPPISIEPYFNSYVIVEEFSDIKVNFVSFEDDHGVVRATIDDKEQLVEFSNSVVFKNGQRVESKEAIDDLCESGSGELFANVCKFVTVDGGDKTSYQYGFICSCLWSEMKPQNTGITTSFDKYTLYQKVGSCYTNGKEQLYMHCDTKSKLVLSDSGCKLTYKNDNQETIDIPCKQESFYCDNQRMSPVKGGQVKAHLRRTKDTDGKERWSAVMVQLPHILVDNSPNNKSGISAGIVNKSKPAGAASGSCVKPDNNTGKLTKNSDKASQGNISSVFKGIHGTLYWDKKDQLFWLATKCKSLPSHIYIGRRAIYVENGLVKEFVDRNLRVSVQFDYHDMKLSEDTGKCAVLWKGNKPHEAYSMSKRCKYYYDVPGLYRGLSGNHLLFDVILNGQIRSITMDCNTVVYNGNGQVCKAIPLSSPVCLHLKETLDMEDKILWSPLLVVVGTGTNSGTNIAESATAQKDTSVSVSSTNKSVTGQNDANSETNTETALSGQNEATKSGTNTKTSATGQNDYANSEANTNISVADHGSSVVSDFSKLQKCNKKHLVNVFAADSNCEPNKSSKVFKNCQGNLYWEESASQFKLATKTNGLPSKLSIGSRAFCIEDGIISEAKKLTDELLVQFDVYYESRTKVHIGALWKGTKPSVACIKSGSKKFYYDIAGVYRGVKNDLMMFDIILNGQIRSITTEPTKAVYDEEGQHCQTIPASSQVSLHLKESCKGASNSRWSASLIVLENDVHDTNFRTLLSNDEHKIWVSEGAKHGTASSSVTLKKQQTSSASGKKPGSSSGKFIAKNMNTSKAGKRGMIPMSKQNISTKTIQSMYRANHNMYNQAYSTQIPVAGSFNNQMVPFNNQVQPLQNQGQTPEVYKNCSGKLYWHTKFEHFMVATKINGIPFEVNLGKKAYYARNGVLMEAEKNRDAFIWFDGYLNGQKLHIVYSWQGNKPQVVYNLNQNMKYKYYAEIPGVYRGRKNNLLMFDVILDGWIRSITTEHTMSVYTAEGQRCETVPIYSQVVLHLKEPYAANSNTPWIATLVVVNMQGLPSDSCLLNVAANRLPSVTMLDDSMWLCPQILKQYLSGGSLEALTKKHEAKHSVLRGQIEDVPGGSSLFHCSFLPFPLIISDIPQYRWRKSIISGNTYCLLASTVFEHGYMNYYPLFMWPEGASCDPYIITANGPALHDEYNKLLGLEIGGEVVFYSYDYDVAFTRRDKKNISAFFSSLKGPIFAVVETIPPVYVDGDLVEGEILFLSSSLSVALAGISTLIGNCTPGLTQRHIPDSGLHEIGWPMLVPGYGTRNVFDSGTFLPGRSGLLGPAPVTRQRPVGTVKPGRPSLSVGLVAPKRIIGKGTFKVNAHNVIAPSKPGRPTWTVVKATRKPGGKKPHSTKTATGSDGGGVVKPKVPDSSFQIALARHSEASRKFLSYQKLQRQAEKCKKGVTYQIVPYLFNSEYELRRPLQQGTLKDTFQNFGIIEWRSADSISAICCLSSVYYKHTNDLKSWDGIAQRHRVNAYAVLLPLDEAIVNHDGGIVNSLAVMTFICGGPKLVSVHNCASHNSVVMEYNDTSSTTTDQGSPKTNHTEFDADLKSCRRGTTVFSLQSEVLQMCGLKRMTGMLKYMVKHTSSDLVVFINRKLNELIWCQLSHIYIGGKSCSSREDLLNIPSHFDLVVKHCPIELLDGKTVNYRGVGGFPEGEEVLPGIHVCDDHSGSFIFRDDNKVSGLKEAAEVGGLEDGANGGQEVKNGGGNDKEVRKESTMAAASGTNLSPLHQRSPRKSKSSSQGSVKNGCEEPSTPEPAAVHPSTGARRKVRESSQDQWSDEEQEVKTGVMIEVHAQMGRLQLESGEILYIPREKCHLLGLSLHNVELWHVLSIDMEVQYEEMGEKGQEIKRVCVGGSPPQEKDQLFSAINAWCDTHHVSSSAKGTLLMDAGWLPPDEPSPPSPTPKSS